MVILYTPLWVVTLPKMGIQDGLIEEYSKK